MPDDVKYLRYLGDSVYASVTNGMIKLYTDNGVEPPQNNIIWFEVETVDSFLEWLADMRAKMIAEREIRDA
jgi:hypothetical protein